MKSLSGMLLVFAVGGLAAQKMEPLNLKPGLWEMTITSSGQIPIPPEALARLTPEQRAKFEERMKARAGGETVTHKECLTKEKLEKSMMFEHEHKDCTRSVNTSTGSKLDLHFTCDKKGTKVDVAVLMEALNSETVKGTTHVTGNGATNTFNMSSTFLGKWVGAACGDVE